MACCVFAAFLLANLLAPFALLRRRLCGAADRGNEAVAWRYGAAVAESDAQRSAPDRWWGANRIILALGLLCMVGLAAYLAPLGPSPATQHWSPFDALHASWCEPGEAGRVSGWDLQGHRP